MARHPVLICCTTASRIRKCRSRFAREFGKTSCRYRHQKDERKRKQIETAPKKEQGGQTDQISRQTSNLRAIASSPAADWSVERRLEYIEWPRTSWLACEEFRLGSNSNSTRPSKPPGGRSIHRWLVRSRKRIVDGNWAVTFDFGPSPRRNRFAVDGPVGGGRVKWQFKCRAKPPCALPSFVNGGIITAWAAVQAHLNQTVTTEPSRSRGMSCRAIYQLRLSTSTIKNSINCSRLLSQNGCSAA